MMKPIKAWLILLTAGILAAVAFVWFGVYNVAADDPHWRATHSLMDAVRSRSVSTRAAEIAVPALDDPALILSGAGNYDAMCVSCHLSPGASDTELSLGLYPTPPTWSELGVVDPREAFWVIKHGVKMSGMPAWGKSMDERYIWGMVALLQQFPRMTAAQYQTLIAESPGHDHGGGETNVRMGEDSAHMDSSMPGMNHPADAPRSSFEPPEDPMAESTRSDPEAPVADDGHQHKH